MNDRKLKIVNVHSGEERMACSKTGKHAASDGVIYVVRISDFCVRFLKESDGWKLSEGK